MQFLFKNKKKYNEKTIHGEIRITHHINPPSISAPGLILESRVYMGCDTDFAMYYSLSIY